VFKFWPNKLGILRWQKKHKGDKKVVLSSWNKFSLPQAQIALSEENKKNHQGMD
jgi:hypothetical protein